MKQLLILSIILFGSFKFTIAQMNPNATSLYLPDNSSIRYNGRIDFENPKNPRLISAGSYFTFNFTGTSCTVSLDYEFGGDGYAFIAIECDGKYHGRIKVDKKQEKYIIVDGLESITHSIKICKATEAITGYIELKGIECSNLEANKDIPKRRIEYIGNSITSGAESDTSVYPCNSGVWHDRHNAYLAYGPRLARELSADWLLSSVSGMGLTRNWNNEGPALPAFYDNLYLNSDSSKRWSVENYKPDLITICLGTNDNSGGDGSYDRKPLDSAKFVNTYIQFVNHLHKLYPDAVICLINSPVFDGELRNKFESYLEATVNSIKQQTGYLKLYYISYQHKYDGGCSGHPSIDDHRKMADELLPYIKKITGWND